MSLYKPREMQELLNSIEDNLTEGQQKTVREIVANYNKLYIVAVDKIRELKRREKAYIQESNENERLKTRNKFLERKYSTLKEQCRQQGEYIKCLDKYRVN